MSLSTPLRAVVTGAGSGLGRAFCLQLAARGAHVLATDIRLADAQATAALAKGGTVQAFACDVTKVEQVEALAAEAERAFGGANLLVNNAGVAVAGEVGQVPLENWRWIVDVNLWGVIYGCHVFIPGMKRRGGGHIINVASLAGIACAPTMAPYNVTKAGVIALSETLHGELANTKIGVTAVCPSFFPTNIGAAARTEDPTAQATVDALMRRSKYSADDIARIALEGADAGELYVLPHAEAKAVWSMKRLLPQTFHGLAGKVADWRKKRALAG